MPSSKERARWERWYEEVSARMTRQKEAITRLVLITTQQRAALLEIAAMDPAQKSDCVVARTRAQQCLDATEAYATAVPQQAEELRDEPDPSDPRKKEA
jgi:hypothetical protein